MAQPTTVVNCRSAWILQLAEKRRGNPSSVFPGLAPQQNQTKLVMAPPSPAKRDLAVPSDATVPPPSTAAPPNLIFHPLPQVQPRSGVWRGRSRYVDFKVRKLDAAKLPSSSSSSSSSCRSPLNVTWDRSQPCQEQLSFPHHHLPGPHHREVGLLMGALADLKANVVVTLGQDRLSEAQAQKHIRLYQDYQAQKATVMKDKTLIRTTDKRGNRHGRKRRK